VGEREPGGWSAGRVPETGCVPAGGYDLLHLTKTR